MEHRYRIGE